MLDRRSRQVHIFSRGARGARAEEMVVELDDEAALADAIGDESLLAELLEDAETLDELTEPLALEKLLTGEQTPVLFGSAMTNFGVQLLLDALMSLGSPPLARALLSSSTMGRA